MSTTHKTPPTTNEEKKRKLDLDSSSDDERSTQSMPFVPFLVVEPVNKESQLTQSIFAIQKFALSAIGSLKSAKKLRSGSLLLEVKDKAQYDVAMSLTKWLDVDVKVSEHRGLNSCRGVIRCRDLRDSSDEEILEALQSQKVTAIRHIMSKKDKQPTNTFILTFRMPSPPSHVLAAYLRIPVERFIPNPLRCYNCQRYGHSKVTCNRPAACARCGQAGHGDTDCTADEHCCNCNGNHAAYSQNCTEWQRQREITRLKCEKNISFAEAKQLLEASSSPKTYAAKLKPVQPVTVATQTEFTWPLTSKNPFVLKEKPTTTNSTSTTGSQTQTPSTSTASSLEFQTVPNSKQPSSSSKPQKSNKNGGPSITRPQKGSDDPVKLFNKFGAIDGMEVDPGPSK
jgi:hypothetical protein